MCEILELCVPLCVCAFRTGVYVIYCFGCVFELCVQCSKRHCDCTCCDNNESDPSDIQVDNPDGCFPVTSQPTSESANQATPKTCGTAYDLGLGWADTHYYEKGPITQTTTDAATTSIGDANPLTSEQEDIFPANTQTSEPTTCASALVGPPPSYEESQTRDGT